MEKFRAHIWSIQSQRSKETIYFTCIAMKCLDHLLRTFSWRLKSHLRTNPTLAKEENNQPKRHAQFQTLCTTACRFAWALSIDCSSACNAIFTGILIDKLRYLKMSITILWKLKIHFPLNIVPVHSEWWLSVSPQVVFSHFYSYHAK